jgi:hypothetical protein
MVHGTRHWLPSRGSRVRTSPSPIVVGVGLTSRGSLAQPAPQSRMTDSTVSRTPMTSSLNAREQPLDLTRAYGVPLDDDNYRRDTREYVRWRTDPDPARDTMNGNGGRCRPFSHVHIF